MTTPLATLGIFAIGAQDGLPISRLPVFAEFVTTIPEPLVLPPGRPGKQVLEAIGRALREELPDATPDQVERLREALSRVAAGVLTSGGEQRLAGDPQLARDVIGESLRRFVDKHPDLAGQGDDDLNRPLWTALRAEADAMGIETTGPAPETAMRTSARPLGIVATDHAGYCSFDLSVLSGQEHAALAAAIEARQADPAARPTTALWVYPLARDVNRIDATAQVRTAWPAVVAKLELNGVVLPPVMHALGLTAMQQPDLTDWRLSPSSFATSPASLLAADGCEDLLPANLAVQEMFAHQVVALTDVQPQDLTEQTRGQVRLGIVHTFRIAWYPLGHSLGQILYSTALAPGESVNLAVIDWSRADDTKRAEDTKITEQLLHDQRRDRSISETTQAALGEYQHGSSFMAGMATSAGASATAGAVGLAGGLANAIGGSTASTSGTRTLAASTMQNLSDHIAQASSSARELQSTVVVQSTQAEHETIETRTIVNYNHSHALTVLYYEVLRHYRNVIELLDPQPAVLVKGHTDWFDEDHVDDTILEYRAVLQAALLDQGVAAGFDAAARRKQRERVASAEREASADPPPKTSPPGDRKFVYFEFDMTTGGLFSENDEKVEVRCKVVKGSSSHELVSASGGPGLNQPGSFRQGNAVNSFTAMVPDNLPWKDIGAFVLTVHPQGGASSDVAFSHIKITAVDEDGVPEVLVDQDFAAGHYIVNSLWAFALPAHRPPSEPAAPAKSAAEVNDEAAVAALVAHLTYHTAYYSRAILLGQQPAERLAALSQLGLTDGTVADKVENRAIEVVGDYVAFPCLDSTWADEVRAAMQRHTVSLPNAERLVTLPTRGVFGEARLGHCNSSEVIDNTRFWDWQSSPIPHLAPEIAAVQPVTPQPRQQEGTTPTALPSPVLNIVNPPSEPNPTGLAAALSAIVTPNVFRDMSGQAEVADLLKKLSDNSVSIAEAANAARAIQAKYGGAGRGIQGSGVPGVGTRANPAQPSSANRDLQDLPDTLRKAVDAGVTTPEGAQNLFARAAEAALTTPEFQQVATGTAGATAGAPSRRGAEVLGIDVSHHQGTINWAKVAAAGRAFAICKATEGLTQVDTSFAANWAGIAKAGLLRGTYHFFRAGEGFDRSKPGAGGEAQAKHFLDIVGMPYGNDLPLIVDFEWDDTFRDRTTISKALPKGKWVIAKSGVPANQLTGQDMTSAEIAAELRAFLEAVWERTLRRPMIYLNAAAWDQIGDPDFEDYPLWISSTRATSPTMPRRGWRTWDMWQFNFHGKVDGIATEVDEDRFYGTVTEFLESLAGNGDQRIQWWDSVIRAAQGPQPIEV